MTNRQRCTKLFYSCKKAKGAPDVELRCPSSCDSECFNLCERSLLLLLCAPNHSKMSDPRWSIKTQHKNQHMRMKRQIKRLSLSHCAIPYKKMTLSQCLRSPYQDNISSRYEPYEDCKSEESADCSMVNCWPNKPLDLFTSNSRICVCVAVLIEWNEWDECDLGPRTAYYTFQETFLVLYWRFFDAVPMTIASIVN